MASTDLIFELPPESNPAELLFGETFDPPERQVTVNAAFNLTVNARVGPRIAVTVNATFTFTVSVDALYATDVDRPLVSKTAPRHQTADPLRLGCQQGHEATLPTPAGFQDRYEPAIALPLGSESDFQQGIPTQGPLTAARHQDAIRVPTWLIEQSYQDGLRDRRIQRSSRHQNATPRRGQWHSGWQERHRDRRPYHRLRHQEGKSLLKQHGERAQDGQSFYVNLLALHQEAIVPPPGLTQPPIPPEPPPCYEPDPNLVFQQARIFNGNLVFLCDYSDDGPPATVVVPIRSVYVVINNISLRRVEGNISLPTFGMSLSIDAESWTWGFNATLPASELGNVMADSNGPIELEANINGNLYRVLAENITRDRTFNNARIRVTGRGKSALLAAPYSPTQVFSNSISRTAQQLMADVLTFNGVPLGWDIDWQLTDWLVPSGAFNVRGSYMDGLLAVAGAAGAYLQPHPVDQELSVLHRYPVAPWEWGTVTPDFELPSAVTVQEGIEWVEKPAYNRVYVSGTSQGVLARVTRGGTAGDLNAPMITDALITAADAGRQRGLAVLADTGRQALVNLRLPVLPETGVITPGKFVRYTDGGDIRLGIVRSTSVDGGWPEVWQQIRVETHV